MTLGQRRANRNDEKREKKRKREKTARENEAAQRNDAAKAVAGVDADNVDNRGDGRGADVGERDCTEFGRAGRANFVARYRKWATSSADDDADEAGCDDGD